MTCLVVEDEPAIRRLVHSQLEAQGVPVIDADSLAAAMAALTRYSFDVVILDLALPDGSGLDVLDTLRREGSEAHVIILSAAGSESDRVEALGRGADDYVVKPFFARELTARVLAVRRRRDPKKDARLEVGPLTLDLRGRLVTAHGVHVEVTAKEFDLLAYLAARPGHVFSREQLLQAVWQSSSDWQQAATVTEHIRRLRTKLEIDPGVPKILLTVRGSGYRLAPGNDETAVTASTPAVQSEPSGTLVQVDGFVVFADQGAADLWGVGGPEDLVGKHASVLVAPQSAEAARNRLARSEGGASLRSETIAIRHAGGGEPLLTVSSEAAQWQGLPARRLQLRPAADPSTRLLHLATGVFSELTDAVIVTDLNFHLRSWNLAAERLYGWRQDEVLGRHVLDILPWTGEEGALGTAWQSLEAEGRWNGKGRHRARDGSVISVLVSLSVMRGDSGDRIGIACVHRPAADVGPEAASESAHPGADDIRRGMANDEFEVYYQPVVRLDGGTITGVEALVRWHHPELGLLKPDAFMPAAEASGLIIDLGNAVLQQACAQTAAWVQSGYDLELAVNLSVRQLADPLLVDRVAAAIKTSGLASNRLWLEVTETTLVDDVQRAAEVLHLLVLHGVRIAIDDFGTGWASLTYLQSFPVQALKIDRTFVAGVDSNPSDMAIARSILSLAAELDMGVVAEGIETAAQEQTLRSLGCITGQGYLYAAATQAESLPLERARRLDDPQVVQGELSRQR